jgi:two-component system heavy metal sensor histidine kinase CusS
MYSSLEEFSRMSKMVSDMLFLAQADNNQLIPEKVTLDLAWHSQPICLKTKRSRR